MYQLLLRLTLVCFGLFAGLTVFAAEKINQLDAHGNRTGWWVVSESNDPVTSGSPVKRKEGYYAKGRKSGPWIYYYDDGKTPRLIGEYADNRPRGSFFRFNKSGDLVQAGITHHNMSETKSFFTDNIMYTCKMMFETKDVFAGQVFFRKRISDKQMAVRFWVENKIESKKSTATQVDFSWLNSSYPALREQFTAARTPELKAAEEVLGAEAKMVAKKAAPEESFGVREAKRRNYFYPPRVLNPITAKGSRFQPDGVNRLYTTRSEIWIDGLFRDGQLWSGKVFVYDSDGILLKVRVYQEGTYQSDGVL